MIRFLGAPHRQGDGITRRELLQAGGMGALGLSLADVLHADAARAKNPKLIDTFGKAKSCIVLFLYGAWSQPDTFDMKPDAPAEIRGEFGSIPSSIPSLRVCEHLPKMARWMDRVTLVRSLTHTYPTHCVAYALSGIPQNPLRNPKEYWPFYGSTMDYLWERDPNDAQPRGIPRNMVLPWELNSRSTNLSHRGLTPAWLGQDWESIYGEFEGQATREKGNPSSYGPSHFDPHDGITPESTFRFAAMRMMHQAHKVGNPHSYAKAGLELPEGLGIDRVKRRRGLLEQFNQLRPYLDRAVETSGLDRFNQLAYDMVTSPKCAEALDVTREDTSIRERYGYTLFGQATLAARRLVESGVRLVTVYWDEFGPANTGWDTHVNNFPRLKDGLLPTLDIVYDALMEDLSQRGMLDDTVVLLMSEHGRTPEIGTGPGGKREHWAGAYCNMFAGAGIQQGQVIGATDEHARFPIDRPLSPKDILATLYHLMGFDPHNTVTYDEQRVPKPLLPHGEIVEEMLV